MSACDSCDTGKMVQSQAYRWGGVAAAIGYVLLIPAVLGVPLGIYMFVDTNTGPPRSGDVNIAGMGAGCAGIMILASLVGGILGLVLIRKKTILECDACGAVVAEG